MFWSTKNIVGIEHYACEITDNNNIPEFSVKFGDTTHKGVSACEAWKSSLEAISRLRDGNSQSALKFHMNNLSGVDLFGFNEQSITKMTESVCHIYQF
jgi:hypothetical protein